ncbi:hypothetical protein [Caulobacter phage Kronos]|uniref:Uncharacterized protein n=1 Tax=Caulobacter phage Kronos TaxID=2340873 RepID=A0A386KSP1_9CAUD|nr:hypothetical protein [Caulobacter phage Kronos]
MQLRPLQVARIKALLSEVGDDGITLPGTLLAKLWSDAGASATARGFWDVGDNTCRRTVDSWALHALLELRQARVDRAAAADVLGDPLKSENVRYAAHDAGPQGGPNWLVLQYGRDEAMPARGYRSVLRVTNAGNPDVFAQHVANCLNLNADYSASLLPVVRLLLDYQDGNRTAEQGRAYWRELRRMVAHYDAVTGKEPKE